MKNFLLTSVAVLSLASFSTVVHGEEVVGEWVEETTTNLSENGVSPTQELTDFVLILKLKGEDGLHNFVFSAVSEIGAELHFRNLVNERELGNLHWGYDKETHTFKATDYDTDWLLTSTADAVDTAWVEEEWVEEETTQLTTEWVEELDPTQPDEVDSEWVEELSPLTTEEPTTTWVKDIEPKVVEQDLTKVAGNKVLERVEPVAEWVEEIAPEVVTESVTSTTANTVETTVATTVGTETVTSVERQALPNTGDTSMLLVGVIAGVVGLVLTFRNRKD